MGKVSREAAVQRLKKLFGSKNVITREEAYLADNREVLPEKEQDNKIWLRNRLTALVAYNFIEKKYKKRLLISIKLTEEGKKVLNRNEEDKTADISPLPKVIPQTTIPIAKREKVSFTDILELLSTFKKENPEYHITFDFSIKLKEE